MTAEFTLEIPRHWLLTANQRGHWRRRAERTATLRWAARHAAVTTGAQPMNRARCTVLIHWPDRRRRDAHNITPTIKAAIDGVVDAGLLPDDDDTHLTGPDLRVSPHLCDKRYACTLHFRFEPIP